MKKIIIFLLVASVVLGMSGTARAEENEVIEANFEPQWGSAAIENGVNCFDHYTFQSVDVSANPEYEKYGTGEPINFSGFIANNNDYPVMDGNVYARVSKYNENYTVLGHDIIDEFFVIEDVAIDKNGQKELNFAWQIPDRLSGGNYNVDFFFSVGKKFNLGGLPFSNEIIAGTTQFSVESQNSEQLYFDRTKTLVNGEKYEHIGNWPIFEKNSEVKIVQNLVNSFDKNIEAKVTFDTYYWDSLKKEDLLKTETITVNIPRKSNQDVAYTIPNAERSVYYVQATAVYENSKSIVNTRFSIEGTEKSQRLNYPAITQFPIKKGDSLTLFTCFHNTDYSSVEGSVEVKLLDQKRKEIAVAAYEGIISSAMSAIKKDLVAENDYENVIIQANIKDKNGNIVDEYEAVYSCEKIGRCAKSESAAINDKEGIDFKEILLYIFLVVPLAVILFFVIRSLLKKKGMMKIFIFFFAMGAWFLANDASAASVNSSKSYDHRFRIGAGVWIHDEHIATGTVTLSNVINGGTSLSCGGSATYSYAPTLSFSATGGSWDTPYGKICDSGYNSASCFGSNIRTPNSGASQGIATTTTRGHDGWIYWTSQKPTVSLSSSNSTIVSCSGMTCTAQPGKSGTVTITANFGAANAKIWSGVRFSYNSGNPPTPALWGMPDKASTTYYTSPSDSVYGTASGQVQSGWRSYLNADGANTLSLAANSVSWNVTVGSCAVNASCGVNAKTYAANATAWQLNTPIGFCAIGSNPASDPPFSYLTVGSSIDWYCSGVNGGTGRDCTASRSYYTCGGTVPNGTTQIMCPSDNASVTVATNWANVGTTSASCTAGRKCEYYTPTYSCIGNILNAHMCPSPNDDSVLTANKDKDLVSSCGYTSGVAWYEIAFVPKCQFVCDDGYHYDSSTDTCVANQDPYECTGEIPTGSTMCTGDNSDLTGTLVWEEAGDEPGDCSSRKCEYYTPAVAPAGVCGGNARTFPYTATAWPGTDNTDFCSTGTPPGTDPAFPDAGGSVVWVCSGSTDMNCSATKQRNLNWQETSPSN